MAIDWDASVLAGIHDTFGEPVTYIPVTGSPFAATGVFDRAFKQVVVLEDGSQAMTSAAPVLGVRLSQWPAAPVQNDKVQIPSVGATFIVREVRPDGHGEAKLMLMKVGS